MSQGRRIAVFAYGSLVSRASATATLGALGALEPAELRGWRRGFTQARYNPTCEKAFARADTGELIGWILSLGVEPAPGGWANGALLELDERQAARLDAREIRYERREVTPDVLLRDGSEPPFDHICTYVARAEHRAPNPPPGAVILATYAGATEAAFGELGAGELERYRASTRVPPVELVDGRLVSDSVLPGNPREW